MIDTIENRRNQIISEHLPYELEMLRATYNLLRNENQDQVLLNALIESFSLHARNLTAFLQGKEDAKPRIFAVGSYKQHGPLYESGLLERINIQICHVGEKRGSSKNQKLSGVDRDRIFDGIETAMQEFVENLGPTYKRLWPSSPKEVIKLEASPPSATNSIIVSKTTITGQ